MLAQHNFVLSTGIWTLRFTALRFQLSTWFFIFIFLWLSFLFSGCQSLIGRWKCSVAISFCYYKSKGNWHHPSSFSIGLPGLWDTPSCWLNIFSPGGYFRGDKHLNFGTGCRRSIFTRISGCQPVCLGLEQDKKMGEDPELGCGSALGGSQLLPLSNMASFSGSPACGWHTVKLLILYNRLN